MTTTSDNEGAELRDLVTMLANIRTMFVMLR